MVRLSRLRVTGIRVAEQAGELPLQSPLHGADPAPRPALFEVPTERPPGQGEFPWRRIFS